MLGTLCKITIYDNPSDVIFQKAFDKIRQIENEMSINLDTSEVININAKAGEEFVEVSEETFYVIKKGVYYSTLTKGLFDISIGPLVKLWDIGGNNPRVPSSEEIEIAKSVINYNDVLLDEAGKKVMLKSKGMILDLGGIAKGYAADAVAEVLIENGVKHALINLGGNVLTLGTKLDGSNWRVGIQNPFSKRGEYVGVVEVVNQTVVTSGIYERYFKADDKHYHHILNPSTGYPYENNLAGITIITEKSIDADSLSTSAFALGLEEGYKFVEGIIGVEAIFVTTNYDVYVTSGLVNNFNITDGSFSIKKFE
jgi:thiamine biosynthesis lipoprotein